MNAMGIRVSGADNAILALNQRLASIKGVTLKELIRLGLAIQGRSQDYIKKDDHIDTGNLRASAFTTWSTGPEPKSVMAMSHGRKSGRELTPDEQAMFNAVYQEASQSAVKEVARNVPSFFTAGSVVVGYGAFYALFVHEDGVTRNWTGAKFLERAINDARKAPYQTMVSGLKRLVKK